MKLDISLAPEILFNLGSLPVTSTLLWSFILSLVIIAGTLAMRFSLKAVPGRWQGLFEIIIDEGMKFVESIMKDKEKAKRVFPLVFTMFIFIVFANLLPFIPGQAAVTLHTAGGDIAPFRAIMSDYGMVFVLTAISIITIQIVAIVAHGPFGYLGKFINLKSPLAFVLGLMDLIGELSKILSLSFRLFGNIFAGEVLGLVMLFLAPFIIPLPFALLGLITAIIQGFVFSLLTLIFISMAGEIEVKEEKKEIKVCDNFNN
jgi:F-type H+-transporting ATPase subunit a